jgi:hypothetical protein
MATVDLSMRAVDLEAQLRQRDKLLAIIQNHALIDMPPNTMERRAELARMPVDERVRHLEQEVRFWFDRW